MQVALTSPFLRGNGTNFNHTAAVDEDEQVALTSPFPLERGSVARQVALTSPFLSDRR